MRCTYEGTSEVQRMVIARAAGMGNG
jgi:alkylation response protein AidB-like acyl-CoA dehydrogenase